MIVDELFDACLEVATSVPAASSSRRLHEVLATACAEATRGTGQGYGNLFAQVDYLCRRHGVAPADRVAIQTMRRHSNQWQPTSRQDLLYDIRALSLFLSAVFAVPVPHGLLTVLPPCNRPLQRQPHINHDYIRCIVRRWDDATIEADTDEGTVEVDYGSREGGVDLSHLRPMLRQGMQLNLLDCHVEPPAATPAGDAAPPRRPGTVRVTPRLVVVEPDFLIDISTLARCFDGYASHPLLYTAERLRPRANTQAMLLGNFAGDALDDIVNRPDSHADATLRRSFRRQALQFCACDTFDAARFRDDARRQVRHIAEAVEVLFGTGATPPHDRRSAILEPSFVCEQLGLQGRVDLMTTDLRLLVEQKSGRNLNIERLRPTPGGQPTGTAAAATPHRSLQKEDHYVQLLLYYGVLRYNFGRSADRTDMRLLYSRYPAASGLLYVNFYQQLFRDAIRLRNQIVATEYLVAREGFGRIAPCLTPSFIYASARQDGFYHEWIEPSLAALRDELRAATPLEWAYYERMLTFVYREQLLQKVGAQEGQGSAVADLWNMPLSEKIETGNIYTGLTISDCQRSAETGAFDLVSLSVPRQSDDFLPNFRRGDMVYLYRYVQPDRHGNTPSRHVDAVPDVRRAILHKGTLQQVLPDGIVVRLANGQQQAGMFGGGLWAVEHAGSDQNTTGCIKGLHQFLTAPPPRRQLLLGQRTPRRDATRVLSRPYHDNYDDILLRQRQALDYFLLVGPPGTGKTSMALRFMVEEELAQAPHAADGTPTPPALLLTAYTNRAVDEICAMLTRAGLEFLRLGSESACDPAYRKHLMSATLAHDATLQAVRQRVRQTPIVVGTTSMLQARAYLLTMKRFSLCIVDEASQILEPSVVGLLSSPAIGRFVLVGDYKQLPAVVQQDEADARVTHPLLQDIGITDCRQSLFERLYRWERRCGRTDFIGILRHQGRMHPDVADFATRHFYHSERLQPVPCTHQTATSLGYDAEPHDALDRLMQQRRVLFIPSARCLHADVSEKVNESEAAIVADVLRRIHRYYGARFDAARTVGVIVPYRNQIAMIRRELQRLGTPALMQVSIDTVERYQGSQRDVIVYSFTVQTEAQLRFLTANSLEEDGRTIDRKLNVALTRARCQMIMTGNAAVLSRNGLFRELIQQYDISHELL